jgi:hypothetical protein
MKAAWICGIERELAAASLAVLADKGYHGAALVKTPYRGTEKPESQKRANRAHAILRAPGERANAQLKAWKILTRLYCCRWRAGQIAKAILVLQAHKTKQDEKDSVWQNCVRRVAKVFFDVPFPLPPWEGVVRMCFRILPRPNCQSMDCPLASAARLVLQRIVPPNSLRAEQSKE